MTAHTMMNPRLNRPSTRLPRQFDDRKAWVTSLSYSDSFQGVAKDPQSFHKYTYVHSGPVNGIDPTGLFTARQTVAAVSIVGVLGVIGYAAYELYKNKLATDIPPTPSLVPIQLQTVARRNLAAQERNLATTAEGLAGHFQYVAGGPDFAKWFVNPAGFDPTDASEFQLIQSDNYITYALWSARKEGFGPGEIAQTLQQQGGGGAQGLYNVLVNLGYAIIEEDDVTPGDVVFFGGNPNAPANVRWTHEGIVGTDDKIWHNTSGHGQVAYDFIGRGYLFWYPDVEYLRPPR